MSEDPVQDRALREAAAWFAQLRDRTVDAATLKSFYDWRTDPINDVAYGKLEALWRQGRTLEDDPEIRAAVRDALERAVGAPPPRPATTFGRWLLPAAGVALALLAAMGTAQHYTRPPTYETHVGELERVGLADGSQVTLDTDSRLAARLDGDTRQVTLKRGRAMFAVASDPARPFIVKAGGAEVTAIGTRFEVAHEQGEVRVTLLEGVVEVRGSKAGGPSWRLRPGEQILVGSNKGPAPGDLQAAASWTEGRLVFRDRPLAQALDEANRYSERKIRLDTHNDMTAARVSGVFRTGDVEALAEALAQLYVLDLAPSPGGDLVLRDRAG